MKNSKTGTVLIYNCRGAKFAKLPQILAMLRIRMRRVEPNQYNLSLLELARGEGEPMENPGEPIAEDMLVFCGLNQAFLNQLLEVIRLGKFPPILKAMLTEDNKDWNSVQLRDELLEEKNKIEAAAAEKSQEQ
jgi:hypothetical protein